MPDCFNTPALAFNLAERYQCPVIILADLLMCEGNETVDPALLDVEFHIDRGELITEANGQANGEPYLRYKDTPSGISPRGIPGVPGHLYVAGTDEHDEDGVLLSDVFTDTVRRKKMVDKRARKMSTVLDHVPAPKLEGPADAEVTLVGWGSTWGVLVEAAERLRAEGISTNHLQIKFLLPFHAQEVSALLQKSRRIIDRREQLQRPVRSPPAGRNRTRRHGPIRKYDGEPFEPKHIVAGVKEILQKGTKWSRCFRPSPAGRPSTPPAPAATGQAGSLVRRWGERSIIGCEILPFGGSP